MSTIILGVNAAHDAAACIVVDGVPRIAVAEERLTRSKRHEGFPRLAVEYCLKNSGIPLSDINAVVINEYVFHDSTVDVRRMGYAGRVVVNPSHHMLHAYYAWVGSNFPAPAILVLDGNGYSHGEYVRRDSPLLGQKLPVFSEMEEAESTFRATIDGLSVVDKKWGMLEAAEPFYRFPSLGHMFSVASEYIFGHMQHAGKTMGLAPYGDASSITGDIVTLTDEGAEVDTDWITRLPARSSLPAHEDAICRDVAAKVQQELERAVIHIARILHARTRATDLCVSGGVGLNSVTNGKLLKETPFDRLFITPAAGDSGVALGAALYGYHQVTGQAPVWRDFTDYLGHNYGRDDVTQAIARRAEFLTVDQPANPARAAADDLVAGRFVGWFEGSSEFGPRALGHRSTLCDPRPSDMRDRLNAHVKFREPFRPYAASVLSEHVGDWFDTAVVDDFMMSVHSVLPHRRAEIESVCHVDNTCRIQTVDADHLGGYRQLIEAFHARTGVPLVLNTSFNLRGEPIVETPDDALRCFLACNLDVLYLHGHRITKHTTSSAHPERLNARLVDGIVLRVEHSEQDNAPTAPMHQCITRTRHRITITEVEYRLLAAIRPDQTVAQLGGDEVIETLNQLQLRGIICFAHATGEGESDHRVG